MDGEQKYSGELSYIRYKVSLTIYKTYDDQGGRYKDLGLIYETEGAATEVYRRVLGYLGSNNREGRQWVGGTFDIEGFLYRVNGVYKIERTETKII